MALFNDDEQQRIMTAIAKAEISSSAQIRVCIEKTCNEKPLDRAVKYFRQLNMNKTKERNGVLIYVATVDRKFAIIGDAGLNKVVPENFWDETKKSMLEYFKFGNIVEGIIVGIEISGLHLKKYFPKDSSAINELPDDIEFMDTE